MGCPNELGARQQQKTGFPGFAHPPLGLIKRTSVPHMGLSIWNILKACLLMTNAGAILHETRFLPAIGMPHVGSQQPGEVNEGGVKMKIAGLLNAVRYLRVPLIFLNILAVFFELLLG